MVGGHIPVSFPYFSQKDQCTLPVARLLSEASKAHEKFYPHHAEVHPGKRIADVFSDRIKHFTTHPAKQDTETFQKWLDQVFVPMQKLNLSDPRALIMYTDGSVLSDPNRSGCAWVVLEGGENPSIICEGSAKLGKCHSHDTEFSALELGLRDICDNVAPGSYSSIIVYADNQAVLDSVLSTKVGPVHHQCIMVNKMIRQLLTESTDLTFDFVWVPSHVRVFPWNDYVDAAAKAKASPLPSHLATIHVGEARLVTRVTLPEFQARSFAFAKSCLPRMFLHLWKLDS